MHIVPYNANQGTLDTVKATHKDAVVLLRMKDCMACGPNAAITAESLPAYSYTDFTGQAANDTAPPQLDLLPADQR